MPDNLDHSGASGSPAASSSGRSRHGEPALVVGMVLAAGGVQPLQAFFSSMPADSGLAFVVLAPPDPGDPGRDSRLPEALRPVTSMPVEPARHDVEVEADRIYLSPADAVLTMRSGRLEVRACASEKERRSAVDAFLCSLAEGCGERAACAILSDLGGDGAVGVEAVKEHGGLALAQPVGRSEHGRAEHGQREHGRAEPGARAAGSTVGRLLDDALDVADMPARLLAHVQHREQLRARRRDPLGTDIARHLQSIWRVLRTHVGHDFSLYKPSSLIRRIERRMHILRAGNVAEYVAHLHDEPREARCLFEELLIGVTHFFRDGDAFRALEQTVIPALFEGRSHGDPIRVWVPGCATGEEAYSIAMLLREHLDHSGQRPPLQVFATDIDKRALEVARQGRYPASVVCHLPPARLERFFREDGGQYRVDTELREMCLFTNHNLLADPPFSRQDLISCRNLLIYFEQEAQRRLVPLFHYALQPGGFLFLGPSEALAAHPELFAVTDKKHRIFRRQEGVKRPALEISTRPVRPAGDRDDPRLDDTGASSEALMSRRIERAVLDEHAFPTVTVNQRLDILYTTGPTSRYLSLPSGQPQLNLLQMAKRDLRLELYAVLHEAFDSEDRVEREARVTVDGEDRRVRLIVRPLSRLTGQSGLYMMVFQDLGPALAPAARQGSGDSELVRQLEADLEDTRQHLQSTVEKLEASNEELRSSNEELLSINEELQSANEELQTSKEELQSTNEELETVNAKLSRKVEELDRANSDLLNLFQSSHVPTLFLDRALRIVRFTAAARELFRLIDTDLGRSIGDITCRFTDADLEDRCHQVLDTLERQAVEVRRTGDGAVFIMRISPYRTVQDTIDGVVVTFADITGLKRAQEALARSETRYRSLLETLTSVVWTCTADGRVTEPQSGLADYTGQPFEAAGQTPPEGWLGEVYTGYAGDGWLQAVHPEDRELVRARWHEAVAAGAEFRAMGRIYHAASRSYRHFEARAVPIYGHSGTLDEWVGTLADVHDRRTTELALLESQSRLDLAVRATELGIFELDPDRKATRSNVNHRRILGLALDREPSYDELLACVHPGDRERVDRAVQQALDPAGTGVYDLEYRVVWPDGSIRWVHGKARGQFEERAGERQPVRLVGTIQDITEKMRVQAEVERRAAQQAAVSELGLQAMQHSELQEVLDQAADIVTKTLEVPFCKVLERLPDKDELLLRAGVGWNPGLVGSARLPTSAHSQAGYTLQHEHPVVVRDLAADPRFKEPALLLEHGVVSGMSVVIKGPDSDTWGVISAHSDKEQAFTQDDVNFLQAVANILAGTIARVNSERALRAAKRSAEEANAAKDRFLAVLSHELRTPLTPVLAAASALESNPDLPEEVSEVLRMVRRNVDLEARLLDDLLDLTRISQGKLKLEPQPVSAQELLERTIGICAQDAKLKGVTLELDMSGRDWTLHVDPSRAMQIFWNLLNNAIKYTPAGGRVEVACAKAPGHRLRIEITDTGAGMDTELLARVFEPFEQGPPADLMSERFSSQRRGLGLGLAIVRALVHGHGGEVSAQSAGWHRGTTFGIDLPLAPEGMEGDLDLDSTGPVDLPNGPIRLLLVEDHEDSAEILATVLEARGMAVTVAASGREALAAASEQHFDVVVSDIGLPDMPGYQLFTELRQQQPHIRGVAYSGYGMDSDVQRCMAAGFREHLTKPVDMGKLERAVYRLMMK